MLGINVAKVTHFKMKMYKCGCSLNNKLLEHFDSSCGDSFEV